MYKLCKTEQSAQRQRQLEAGLLDAMCTKRYEEITVSDLCEQMQIPRKSFYRYFSSKDGALHALLDHTILEYERLSSFFNTVSCSTVQQEMNTFFTHWLKHKKLLDALERSGLSGMLVERAISQAHREHSAPMLSQTVETMLLHNHAVAFMTCGIMSMAIQWHHQGYRQTPQEMAQIATHIATQPLISVHRQY